METPVVFKSAGFQLVGILHRPDSAIPNPQSAILLLHGFTGQKVEAHRLYVKTARALARAGFIALRFDFRGSGDSGGEFEQITIIGWREDARTALEFLLSQPGVDAARVGVLGLSTGGAVGCHLAANAPRVRSLALWSAVADGTGVISQAATPEGREHLQKNGWVDREGNKVSAEFLREFAAMRPSDDLARARCAVIIVHGAADDTVPVVQADVLEKAARASDAQRRVEKLIIPSGDHTYANIEKEARVIDATVAWFQRTL